MIHPEIKVGDLFFVPPPPGKVGFRLALFLKRVGNPIFSDGDTVCEVLCEGKHRRLMISNLRKMDDYGNLVRMRESKKWIS